MLSRHSSRTPFSPARNAARASVVDWSTLVPQPAAQSQQASVAAAVEVAVENQVEDEDTAEHDPLNPRRKQPERPRRTQRERTFAPALELHQGRDEHLVGVGVGLASGDSLPTQRHGIFHAAVEERILGVHHERIRGSLALFPTAAVVLPLAAQGVVAQVAAESVALRDHRRDLVRSQVQRPQDRCPLVRAPRRHRPLLAGTSKRIRGRTATTGSRAAREWRAQNDGTPHSGRRAASDTDGD